MTGLTQATGHTLGGELPSEVTSLPAFKTPPPRGMREREARFCRWYVVVQNGTLAALRAGYSVKHADSMACKVRKREPVRAYIEALRLELETGQALGEVSPAWVAERYRAIAQVREADLIVEDPETGPRWKQLSELTPVERSAIAKVSIRRAGKRRRKPGQSEQEAEQEGEVLGRAEIDGYTLYPATEALNALARFAGMHRDQVRHDHAVHGSVKGLFQFVAGREATSETVARLRAKYGAAGARVIEHDSDTLAADPRALRKLKGI